MVWKVVGLIVFIVVPAFVFYVSTREGRFRYERSGVINAPAEKIFPYISDLRKGNEWSPFTGKDPNMKFNYIGDSVSPGSVMEFNGNAQAGSGKIEMLKTIPNEVAEYKLTMIKPFFAENLVEYRLTPEGSGTRMAWIMSGDGGFLGKLMNVFIDCEKLVAGDFETGISNLKRLVESQK